MARERENEDDSTTLGSNPRSETGVSWRSKTGGDDYVEGFWGRGRVLTGEGLSGYFGGVRIQ